MSGLKSWVMGTTMMLTALGSAFGQVEQPKSDAELDPKLKADIEETFKQAGLGGATFTGVTKAPQNGFYHLKLQGSSGTGATDIVHYELEEDGKTISVEIPFNNINGKQLEANEINGIYAQVENNSNHDRIRTMVEFVQYSAHDDEYRALQKGVKIKSEHAKTKFGENKVERNGYNSTTVIYTDPDDHMQMTRASVYGYTALETLKRIKESSLDINGTINDAIASNPGAYPRKTP